MMINAYNDNRSRNKLRDFIQMIRRFSGAQFGTVLSYPLSGYLCSIPWDNGWPLAFYVPGSLAAVWFVFWLFLAYNGPDVHPRISEDEKRYIMASTKRLQANKPVNQSELQSFEN